MDAGVVAALLAAALLHASWHALVKSSGDRIVALAGMNLVSGLAAIAMIPFVTLPTANAALIIICSVLLHGAYKVALARLYSSADLSQGYPLGRGVTPLIAAALAFFFLGEVPLPHALLGIVLIATGISGLAVERGTGLGLPTIMAALAAGMAVASYSVLDAYGVRLNGDWLSFTVWLVASDSSSFVLYAFATRGRSVLTQWGMRPTAVIVSGLLGLVSFSVFMWALGRAPVGAVAALRETSILFAALLGALALKEKVTRSRLISAALVTLGTTLIALSPSILSLR